jgi:hypothetical protein
VRDGVFRYWRRDGAPDKRNSGRYLSGKRISALGAEDFASAPAH